MKNTTTKKKQNTKQSTKQSSKGTKQSTKPGKKKEESKLELDLPTLKQLENELKKAKYKSRFRRVLSSTVFTLVIVAAVAVLIAMLFLPVLKIFGNSMTPTLNAGEVVVALKTSEMSEGDVVAFYYNNDILVKRVIAGPGDWVDIDEAGNVFVNGNILDEPYVPEKALGECNIELPYQVPDERYFVMGDHRSTSIDSRHTSVGCVPTNQLVGKIIFRIWPFEQFGSVG